MPCRGLRRKVEGRSERASPPLPGREGPGVRATTWAAALRDALRTVLHDDDLDITTNPETGTLEITTDDWTLAIENLDEPDPSVPSTPAKRPTAWLAIDDEPDDPARYRSARRAVMPPAVDHALARADAALAGALRTALEAGEDPFTQDLAAALTPSGSHTPDPPEKGLK